MFRQVKQRKSTVENANSDRTYVTHLYAKIYSYCCACVLGVVVVSVVAAMNVVRRVESTRCDGEHSFASFPDSRRDARVNQRRNHATSSTFFVGSV